MRKERLDAFGVASLSAIALLLAFNQIVIAWVNQGLQPVFFAGLRSVLAVGAVVLWMRLRGRRTGLRALSTAVGGLRPRHPQFEVFLC